MWSSGVRPVRRADVDLDEYARMAAAENRHWWYRATRALLAETFAPLIPAGSLVLDAGCGTGATGAWMAGLHDVVGVDSEPIALQLYADQHPATRLVNADISSLALRDASVDAVLCVTVLCHRAIADPDATVAELVRVMRPGGVICLLEPGIRRLRRAHDRAVHVERRFSVGDMHTLLERNGCRVVRSSGAYSFLVPAAALKSVVERGRSASDLEGQGGALGTALGGAARIERLWLRRHGIPAGLSAWAIATKST
jgi:ubiquinone/menaquinone biosynthesis C-methylase UbiE